MLYSEDFEKQTLLYSTESGEPMARLKPFAYKNTKAMQNYIDYVVGLGCSFEVRVGHKKELLIKSSLMADTQSALAS